MRTLLPKIVVLTTLFVVQIFLTASETTVTPSVGSAENPPAVTASALIGRILGARASDFIVEIIPCHERHQYPIGVVGLEGVWYNTLTQHGFSDHKARTFLVGPTYFAWQWMINIEGHGGPLPKHWIDERVKLGQQWMTRARELGMTPIQQGFSGNSPRPLKQKHPEASISLQT